MVNLHVLTKLLLLVCFSALLSSCEKSVNTAEAVVLEITSTQAVDSLQIKIRNEAYTAYVFDEQIEDKNILEEPYRVALQPTEELNEKFFVYVTGSMGANLVVANSVFADFREPGTIVLRLRTGFADQDGDGFEDCGEQSGSLCDCNDQEASWNPFTEDRCDNSFDENCTGFPNEGCPCTNDIPCTILPPHLANDMAGIGACTTGLLLCTDGVLSDTCLGAGPTGGLDAIFEIPDNYIDDDCDGTVDEGSSCTPGAERACFLGLVDDPGSDTPGAATARAQGICRTGTQTCTDEGDWQDCLGETRSDDTRAPLYWAEQHLGDEEPDLTLPISGRYAQCDGLDNDCDGEIDDEEAFDLDGDGYTVCGSCDIRINDEFISCDLCDDQDSPTLGTSLCSSMIDCNDGDANVHPRNVEACNNNFDDDCRCDHSSPGSTALAIGQSIFLLTGEQQCEADDSNLDCSRSLRSDPSPTGFCSGPEEPGVYYFGFRSEDSDHCYYCGTSFGLSCNTEGTGCTQKENDCTGCLEPDISLMPAIRQTCRAPNGGCVELEPPEWSLVTTGDPYGDCGFLNCDGFYWGIENARCYAKANQPAENVDCKAGGLCETSTDRCPQESERNPTPLAQGLCTKTTAGCTGNQSPVVEPQLNNEDIYNECNDEFVCNDSGTGGGPYYYGVVDDDGNSQVNGNCYFRADILSQNGGSACDGASSCQTRYEACTTSAMGEQVTGRPVCEIPNESESCYGDEGPSYVAVPIHSDPYDDCGIEATCCVSAGGAGMCCQPQGASCNAQTECALGLTCVDGVCCGSPCSTACFSCLGAQNTAGENGTCAPINSIQQDASPGNLCTNNAGGCGGDGNCICEAETNNCKRAAGNTCSVDDNCASGFCECANESCSVKRCSAVACAQCLFNQDGNQVCEGLVADDIDDAHNACSTSCNGLGSCNVVNGLACATQNNQECVSNICILGTCSNAAPTGSACDETEDCALGVCNTDNICRIPGYTLVNNGLLTHERVSDRDDSFTVALTSKPVANVVVSFESSDTGEAVPVQGSVTFTPSNWAAAQTVTIRGQNDNMADGPQAYQITGSFSSSDSDYAALLAMVLGATNADDDVAGVSVSPTTGLSVSEFGTTATFSVVLNTEPTHNVNIAVASADVNKVTVDDDNLKFRPSNWDTAQTVTLTGVDNDIDDGDTLVNISLGDASSGDDTYDDLAVSSVALTVLDDDVAGITINPTSGLETTENGGTASFTVVLDSEPLDLVTVTLESSDVGEGTVSSTSLVFSDSNWDSPKTVTVTGQNDDRDDGDQNYVVLTSPASSNDSLYQINPVDVSLKNLDNDTAGVTVSETFGIVTTESGGQDSFSVVLHSEPSANVTIQLSTNSNEVAHSPASIVFTASNWDVPKTVTLTGQDDDVDDDSQTYDIILGAMVSADGNYSGMDVPNVSGVNWDNDTAGVLVTPIGSMVTNESGSLTATFSVVLTTSPVATVEIPISSSDTSEGSVDLSMAVFNSIDWDSPVLVTVSGVNDDVDDDNVSYLISLGAPFTVDAKYAALGDIDVADVSVTNQDDDSAGFTLSGVTSLTTSEAGSADSFNLKLDSEPTHNVNVSVVSSDAGEVFVDTPSLIFTPSNWNTNQPVAFHGADDMIVDGTKTANVNLGTAQSSDGKYNNMSVGSVTVSNLDNEPVPSVSIADAAVVEGDFGTQNISFLVSVDYASESQITVDWASSDDTASQGPDYIAANGTVTFTALDQAETVAVSVKGDFANEGDENFKVTLSNPTQAQLGDSVAYGTITNDDASPVVTSIESSLVVISPLGSDTVPITCHFTDANDHSVTTFDISIWAREPTGDSVLLCNAVSNGETCEHGGAATVISSATGVYQFDFNWDPPVNSESGLHDLSCMVVDWGYNPGMSNFDDYQDMLELDGIAPGSPNVTSSTPTSNDPRPTWTWTQGTGDGAGIFRLSLAESELAVSAETTDLSYTPTTDLAEGEHTLYVQERDAYGNWSVSGSFTVVVESS